MKRLTLLTTIVAGSLLLSSCKKDEPDPKPALNIPTTYSSPNYDANIVTEAALKSQLKALTDYMKTGENIANVLATTELNTRFTAGNTSLKSITGIYYTGKIENNWFQALADNSGNTYDAKNGASAVKGGVYGNRLLDKGAKETMQEIEKGLYLAAFYNHLTKLAEGPLTEATVDQMIAIYGAHPNFPNTNTAAKTTTPDGYIALYAARRDKNDGNGFYSRIKSQFLKLQAAIKAGSNYNTERDEAIGEIKYQIEKALMSTVIHYAYAGITKLSSTNPSDLVIAAGLHDLGEAIGFVHGFKSLPSTQRKVTDAQIDEILTLLNAPTSSDATVYKFVTDGVTELPKISQAQQKIKAIYNFSDAEMEDFKQNWISVQGR